MLLNYVILKSVNRNDVGEVEADLVLLQALDVLLSEVAEDHETRVDVLEDLCRLIGREVDKLGNDEVEVFLFRDFGEIVEIVGKVTCEEHALAVVGLDHVCVAGIETVLDVVGADGGHADAVFIIDHAGLGNVRVELLVIGDTRGIVLCFEPCIESGDRVFIGKIDVPVCLLVVEHRVCDDRNFGYVVVVHMRDEERANALVGDSLLLEQIEERCAGVDEEAVAVVLKVDRRTVTTCFAMSVAGSEKCQFHSMVFLFL